MTTPKGLVLSRPLAAAVSQVTLYPPLSHEPLIRDMSLTLKQGTPGGGWGSCEYTYVPVLIYIYIWVFPKIGVPQNGWFIIENPIKMDDLGGTTIFGNIHIYI